MYNPKQKLHKSESYMVMFCTIFKSYLTGDGNNQIINIQGSSYDANLLFIYKIVSYNLNFHFLDIFLWFYAGLTARMESWPTLVLGTSLGGDKKFKGLGSSTWEEHFFPPIVCVRVTDLTEL